MLFFKVFKKIFGMDARHMLLMKMPKDSVCAEIGVYKGDFSKKILSVVKPKRLHLIDPWEYESGRIYNAARYGGKTGSQKYMDDIYERVREKFVKSHHFNLNL